MSTSMADLGFNIDSKPMKTATSELNKMSGAAGKAEKSTGGLASATKLLGAAIGAIGVAQLTRSIFETVKNTEMLQASLKTVTGSIDAATSAWGNLTEFAKTTPFTLDQSVKAFIKMKSLGLDPTNAALNSFGNTASAMGKDLNQMIEAVADAATGEFERLKEFGIKASSEGDRVSFTFQGVTTTIGKNASEISGYLQSIGDNQFAGAMADQMDTLNGQVSNLEDSVDGLYRAIGDAGATNAFKFAISAASDAVGFMTDNVVTLGDNLLSSLDQWVAWGDDVNSVLAQTEIDFSEAAANWGNAVDSSLAFMGDAFFNFPSNVRAAIQIAVVELASLVDRVIIYSKMIGEYLDPSVWMDDSAISKIQKRVESALMGVSIARMSSITSILQERDASVSAGESIILNEERKRNAIKLTSASVKKAGEESGEESSEKFVNQWDNAAQTVSQGLQDAIASGEWKNLGDAIGAALASSVSSIISKTITDSLAQNLTANSSILSQIGGAFAGPIAGAIVGAAIQVAIREIENYLGDDFDPTEARQASLGTGTVLGSINKKTESIEKSTDMSATASNELIGINRDMLRALNALNAGISGAASRVAMGAGGVSIQSPSANGGIIGGVLDAHADVLDFLTLGFLDFGAIFGGKSKKKDEGIQIIGGYMSDLIDETIVNAFQTFRVKKHALDDYDTKEVSQRIGGDVETQFALVFGSIFDSVSTATESLNLDVSQALADFRIESTKISLEGLDAGEQQAALQAYFGAVFDNLAEATVPFLTEFQRAGEGLGETLSRVVSIVQVADEVIGMLGVGFTDFEAAGFRAAKDLLPLTTEAFEAIANEMETIADINAKDRLIELSGGIESFISSSSNFIKNFMSESAQFDLNADALTRALGGLGLPETREGFLQLMQAQDAATASGAENISTLLRLQGAANQYYDFLEDKEEKRIEDAEQAARDSAQAAEQAARAAEQAAIELLASLETAMTIAMSSLERAVNAEKELASSRLSTAKATHSAAMAQIDAQRDEIEERRKLAEDTVSRSSDMMQKSFDAERNSIQSIADTRIDALNEEISRANSAADAHRSYANELQSLTDTLLNASSDMSGSNRRSRAQAGLSSALTSARRGDFSQAQSLDISGLSQGGAFGSAQELAIDVARTQNQLEELAGLTGNRASVEERMASSSEAMARGFQRQIEQEQENATAQILALENQMNALLGIGNSVLSLDDSIAAYTEAQGALNNARFDDLLSALDTQEQSANDALESAQDLYDNQISSLDEMLEQGRAQIDAAYGIDNSVVSVRDAIDLLALSVDDYNAEILARASDAEERTQALQYAKESNEKQSEMLAALNRMEESQRNADLAIAKHTAATAASVDRLVRNGIEILEV